MSIGGVSAARPQVMAMCASKGRQPAQGQQALSRESVNVESAVDRHGSDPKPAESDALKPHLALPTNLALPPSYHPQHGWLGRIEEGLFVAGSASYLGACSVVAVLPNLYHRLTEKTFNPEQAEAVCKDLRPGDILLSHSDMHQTFYYFLHSTFGHHYSHAATYAGNGTVYDSYDRADRRDIHEFLSKMTDVAILRPHYTSSDQIKASVSWLKDQVGKDYNIRFRTDDDSTLYCSQMTTKGLEASKVGIKVPGHAVLNHPFVLPDDFLHTPGIDLVGTYTSNPKTVSG